MYVLNLDEFVVRYLEKAPQEIRKRIFSRLSLSKDNPFHFFERLTGRADFRMRVGDYRVIADIDRHNKKILVTLIGHRKDVYH